MKFNLHRAGVKKLLSVLLAALFIGIFVEFSCHLFFKVPNLYQWADIHHESYFQRRWINNYDKFSQDFSHGFDIYDATKGWRSRANIKNMAVFKGKIFNTNSKGFRGAMEYTANKNASLIRIMAVGDSFTFGEEVSDSETYSHYLQQLLPNTEVMNLGVHGYGHDQILIHLQEQAPKYKPDIVLLGFVPNDMKRNLLAFRDYAKPMFKMADGSLLLTNSPVPDPSFYLNRIDFAFIDFSQFVFHQYHVKFGTYHNKKAQVTTAILNAIIDMALSVSAKPVFSYLVTGEELELSSKPSLSEQFFFKFCRNNQQVHCHSTRKLLLNEIKNRTSFSQGHWDHRAHMIGAQSMAKFFKKIL